MPRTDISPLLLLAITLFTCAFASKIAYGSSLHQGGPKDRLQPVRRPEPPVTTQNGSRCTMQREPFLRI